MLGCLQIFLARVSAISEQQQKRFLRVVGLFLVNCDQTGAEVGEFLASREMSQSEIWRGETVHRRWMHLSSIL